MHNKNTKKNNTAGNICSVQKCNFEALIYKKMVTNTIGGLIIEIFYANLIGQDWQIVFSPQKMT